MSDDMSIEFLPLAMANPLAEMTKRAEAAEARYARLEPRAASILLQLDAMKQRAEAAERERDSLREQLQATDARAEGWRTGRDNLRAACEKHRQRIAELEAQLGVVPVDALRFCVDAASYTYDAVVSVADEWLKTLEGQP